MDTVSHTVFLCIKKVKRTSTIDPQQMLIFRKLIIFRITKVDLMFLVSQKRLTYRAAITDGIACRRKYRSFSITGFVSTKYHLNKIGLMLENIINKEEVQRYEDVCDSMISPQD